MHDIPLDGILMVHWIDNKDVPVVSSMHGSGPRDKVKRWNSEERKYVEIERPDAIGVYNNTMGGTDRRNQMANHSRTPIHEKKSIGQL